MTIDEAIKHCEEATDGNENLAEFYYKEPGRNTALGDDCRECAKEHRQLAEWLKDYKRLLEQEPKIGHWIHRNSFLVPYKCSECNYESERYDNYCPNCGAKMIEPQERSGEE